MDLKLDKRVEELERKLANLMRGQHYVAASHINTNRLDAQSAGVIGNVTVGGDETVSGDVNVVGGISTASTIWIAEVAEPGTPSSGWGIQWANTSFPRYKNDAGKSFGMCVDRIWLSARDGQPTWGSPTWTSIYTNYGWYVPADVDSYIYWNIELPPWWSGRAVFLRSHWLAESTNLGNVYEVIGGQILTDGGAGNPGNTFTAAAIVAAPGQYKYRIRQHQCGQTVPDSTSYRGLQWCWWRYGTHASDTYTGGLVFVGMELQVV